MKKIFLIVGLLIGFAASSQTIPGYTPINDKYNWLAGYFKALNLPVGCGAPSLKTNQWRGAGAVYYDSCIHRLYIYKGSGIWSAVKDSSEGATGLLFGRTDIRNSTGNDMIFKYGGKDFKGDSIGVYQLFTPSESSFGDGNGGFFELTNQSSVITSRSGDGQREAAVNVEAIEDSVTQAGLTVRSEGRTDQIIVGFSDNEYRGITLFSQADSIYLQDTMNHLPSLGAYRLLARSPTGGIVNYTGGLSNIYNSDGRLTSDRLLTGDNSQYGLYFDSLAAYDVRTRGEMGKTAFIQSEGGGVFLSTINQNGISTYIYMQNESPIIELHTDSANGHGVFVQIDVDSFSVKYKQRGPNTIDNLTDYKLQARSPSGGFADYTGDFPNIYSIDGSLSGNRTLSGSGNDLTFTGIPSFQAVDNSSQTRFSYSSTKTEMDGPSANSSIILNDSIALTGLTQSNDTVNHKLLVMNTSTGVLAYQNFPLASSGGWSLGGNSATSGNSTGSFLGTTNSASLNFKTNNTFRGRIDSVGNWDVGTVTRFTNYDGSLTSTIRVKQNGNGVNGITFYNAANDATGLSVGAAGIGTDQDLAVTVLGGDEYHNVSRFRLGDNGSATAHLHIVAETATASTEPIRFTVPSSQTTTPVSQAFGVNTAGTKLTYVNASNTRLNVVTDNGTSLTSGTVPVATTNGYLTDGLIMSSGTWTPTLTVNGGASSPSSATGKYSRTGNIVTFSIYFTFTPSGTPIAANIDASLPIASNFTSNRDAIGSGMCQYASSDETAKVQANSTDDRLVIITSLVSDTNVREVYVAGQYEIK